MSGFVDIVFDGPGGAESSQFVEVEDPTGSGITFGEWIHREDGYHVLRIREESFRALPDHRTGDPLESLERIAESLERTAGALSMLVDVIRNKGE